MNTAFQRFSGTGDVTIAPPDVSGRKCLGFPLPSAEYYTEGIDLNRLMVQNRPATFYARAEGESMRDDGIDDGDLVVVDRSLHPRPGDIVVTWVDGAFTLRRHVTVGADYTRVWGVVTGSIHRFR